MGKPDYNYTLPSGFSEFLPREKRLENHLLNTFREVFERYGFTPIETPAVERLEVLQAKGNQGDNIIYSINPLVPTRDKETSSESESEDRALKFDQTVPLAAYIARHLNDLTFPFARYQMDMVFRGERSKKGRYRQFRQCDIDVVGREKLSLLYDAQMPAIINEIFSKLEIGEFVIRVSNRKVLTGLFRSKGLPSKQIKSCIKIIDTLDKIGPQKVRKALVADGISETEADTIMTLVKTQGKPEDILSKLEYNLTEGQDNEGLEQGIKELKEVVKFMQLLEVPDERVSIDLSVARGLDYYTGTVYETNLIGHEALGSICSGGRYEDLVGMFVGKPMPGVGLSIGLTRLLRCLLDERLLSPLSSSPAEVMVINMQEDLMPTYLQLSQKLRSAGVNVYTGFTRQAMGKQLKQADKLGIPFCLILGPDEQATGTCRLKNLETGKEINIRQDELTKEVKEQLGSSRRSMTSKPSASRK